MRQLLNDFASLIFGKKQYPTIELVFIYSFLIFICIVLFLVRDGL